MFPCVLACAMCHINSEYHPVEMNLTIHVSVMNKLIPHIYTHAGIFLDDTSIVKTKKK